MNIIIPQNLGVFELKATEPAAPSLLSDMFIDDKIEWNNYLTNPGL